MRKRTIIALTKKRMIIVPMQKTEKTSLMQKRKIIALMRKRMIIGPM
jgi:hypothetical protein